MERKPVRLRRIASERLPSAFRERFRGAGGGRRAFTRAVRLPAVLSAVVGRRGSEGAAVTYAGILDGGTLNLQVRLPSRGGSAPVRAVRFVAVRGRRRWRGDLGLDGDGLAGGAIRLSEDGGPLALLGTGLWRPRIEMILADGGRVEVPLLGPVKDVLPEGPAIAAPLCPRTGTVYAVETGPAGHVTISASPPGPRAQVTRVRADWDRVVVEGRLSGVARVDGTEARMRRLDGRRVSHRLPVTTDGALFRFEVPGDALAGAEATWVFDVVSSRAGDIEVGRFLNDFRHPHRVVQYEGRHIAASGRSLLHVRPGYSPAGRLLLSCSHSEDLP